MSVSKHRTLRQNVVDGVFTYLYEGNTSAFDMVSKLGAVLGFDIRKQFFDNVDVVDFLKDHYGTYPGQDYVFAFYNKGIMMLPVEDNNIYKNPEALDLLLLMVPGAFVWHKPALQCLFNKLARDYSDITIMSGFYKIMNRDKEQIIWFLDKLKVPYNIS
jgi:hypothetical protein